MPDPNLVQGIANLGALGLTIIAVWALATGRVRVGSLVDAALAFVVGQFEKRLAEVAKERDDWKALAQSATPELKRLNDLLDTAVKLLLDPRRTDEEIERIVREVGTALLVYLDKRQ